MTKISGLPMRSNINFMTNYYFDRLVRQQVYEVMVDEYPDWLVVTPQTLESHYITINRAVRHVGLGEPVVDIAVVLEEMRSDVKRGFVRFQDSRQRKALYFIVHGWRPTTLLGRVRGSESCSI